MNIDVRVIGEEVLLRLDQLPQTVRRRLTSKLGAIFSQLEERILSETPGRFFDKAFIQSGVVQQGDLLIGYLEANDKPGVYSILPVNKTYLINRPKNFFAREVHRHPYLKAEALHIETYLRESKPWILDQINTAVRRR